ncbi:MAG: hypothetical protein UU70_C0033G0001, partial [Candidatus Yanofskybacteria bacterium GW2011_GWA1_41_6]
MGKWALTDGNLVAIEPHHQREFPPDDVELGLGVVDKRLGEADRGLSGLNQEAE